MIQGLYRMIVCIQSAMFNGKMNNVHHKLIFHGPTQPKSAIIEVINRIFMVFLNIQQKVH
jgi:hypothetical protein